MVLRNPTNQTVSIKIDGVDYSISPNGNSRALSVEVATKWKKVHQFLIEEAGQSVEEPTLVVEESVEVPAIVEEPSEITEEDKPVETPVEEKQTKTRGKK